MTIYYVAKTGNDNNLGTTEQQPWLTIQKAADTLVVGDTVYVKSGTYYEAITVKNSGSLGKYITFVVYPGHVVTIDGIGVSMPDWQGQFYIYQKDYIKISGFKIINSPQTGIRVDGAYYIIIENNNINNPRLPGIKVGWGASGNILIDNNTVHRQGTDGWEEAISISNVNVIEVRNNKVTKNANGEGIDFKDGTSNGLMHHNEVYDTSAQGIYLDAWMTHMHDNQVYNNIVHDTSGQGIVINSETGYTNERVKVFNNIVYNTKYSGILVGGGASVNNTGTGTRLLRDIDVYNNVIYNSGTLGNSWSGGIQVGSSLNRLSTYNVMIKNNIVYNNVNFQIRQTNDYRIYNVTISHNLIYQYRGANDEVKGTNYIEAPPQFVNEAGHDFHLQPTSPAIDTGTLTLYPATDFDGNLRPQGAGVDIGAYEYTTAQPPSGELVARYNFNESDGVTILDLSGKGNNGAVYNASVSQDGLTFSGTNSYVEVPNSSSLNANTTNQISVLLEMKLTDLPANQNYSWVYLMSKALSGNDRDYYILIERSTGKCTAGFTVLGTHYSVSSTTIFGIDTTYHIAYTYSQASGQMKLYVNGNLESQAPYSASIPYYSSNLQIGRFDSAYGGYVKAIVKRMSIYTRELTQAEVQADICPPPVCQIQISN